MRKYSLILSGFVLAFTMLSFGDRSVSSNGAPLASTNAPGEQTCTKSGCHSDNALNTGTGLLSIDLGNGITYYEPGHTYDVTVSVQQSGIQRFGFQALVLKNSDNTQAGEPVISDSARTQILTGVNAYEGRKYVTYTYAGTDPYATNKGQWSFKWAAPVSDEGPVTLYVAGVAANNDGTDFGDLAYTKQLTLNAIATGIKHSDEDKMQLSVFPNPVSNKLSINYTLQGGAETTITLTDLLSRRTNMLLNRMDNSGAHVAQINLNDAYAPGVYFLTVTSGDRHGTQKIVIE